MAQFQFQYGVRYGIENIEHIPGGGLVVLFGVGDYDWYHVDFVAFKTREQRDKWLAEFDVTRDSTLVPIATFNVSSVCKLAPIIKMVARWGVA